MNGTDEGLWSKPFVFCWLANFMQGIGFNLFLHFPGFLAELGATSLVIGWLSGVMSFTAIAVRPVIGQIMDVRGRRGLILFGSVLNVFVTGLYLLIHEIGWEVYGIRGIHGVSEAILFTVLFTYAADHVPRGRLTEGLALFGVSGMLPLSIGGILGDWILQTQDYHALFWAALGCNGLALFFAIPLRDAHRPAEAATSTARVGFFGIVKQGNLLPIWWIATLFFIALSSIFVFLKMFVMSREVGSVGGFFTAYAAVAIALRVGLGWVPDRVGPIRVLVPAVCAMAGGMLLLAWAQSSREVLLAGAFCGLGHGYTFPILSGLVVGRAGEGDRGAALAMFTGIADLGAVVGSPLFGWVAEYGGYAALYGLVSIGLIGGLLIFLPWDRWARRNFPLVSESDPDGRAGA